MHLKNNKQNCDIREAKKTLLGLGDSFIRLSLGPVYRNLWYGRQLLIIVLPIVRLNRLR